MKFLRACALVFLGSAGSITLASPVSSSSSPVTDSRQLEKRTSGLGYAPKISSCDASTNSQSTTIQSATSLTPAESAYLALRKTQSSTALESFLSSAGLTDDVSKYINDTTTALVFSGGGYRAMLASAGAFNALDSRTSTGPLSGLLQSMDYISGLSGGSWMVGSSATAGFATIQELRDNIWHLRDNLVLPGDVSDSLEYLTAIAAQVLEKQAAGFETSITDFWSMALGRQLVSRTDGGPNTLWSSVQNTTTFQSGSMPFPILVADSRDPGELVTELNNTIYELNPLEFGSWDIGESYFFPMQSLGTTMNNGQPADASKCVSQFDVAAFMMGTSSSLFNSAFLTLGAAIEQEVDNAVLKKLLTAVVNEIFEAVAATGDDVADYPNPFEGYKATTNLVAADSKLSLVDGGTDGENLALWPVLQKSRGVDFILAVDSSGDTDLSWPAGIAISTTYNRVYAADSGYTHSVPFPFIPDPNTFLNLGLNSNATFFGCNATNYTSQGLEVPPMIIYVPNQPWSYYTNTSTFQLSYTDGEVDGFVNNGLQMMAQGGDEEWAACVACAVVQRAKERAGDAVGDECEKCFTQYCWDGTLDTSTPAFYDPTLLNGSDWTYAQQAAQVTVQKSQYKEQVLGDVLEDLLESAA